jgi:GDP-L-fucose synthase
VDDPAGVARFLMKRYHSEQIINVDSGKDISMQELGELIKAAVGYQGGN